MERRHRASDMADQDTLLRLSAFAAVFLACAGLEFALPRRKLSAPKALRWLNNLAIVALDNILIRLLMPVLAVHVAAAANVRGWGILNQTELPAAVEIAAAVLALDLVIYLQHLMFHAVPLLWRLHMVHHADLDIDVTTALRFHPVEIFISMGIKMAAVAVIGPSVAAVVIFEVVLNATAMFNHANIRLPAALDRFLRLLVVTPDMHRVHHSVIIRETNSNFGFSFPWWDRIFGTYRPHPAAGHEGMTIGLSQFRNQKKLGFFHLLALPFTGNPGAYSMNRIGRDPARAARR